MPWKFYAIREANTERVGISLTNIPAADASRVLKLRLAPSLRSTFTQLVKRQLATTVRLETRARRCQNLQAAAASRSLREIAARGGTWSACTRAMINRPVRAGDAWAGENSVVTHSQERGPLSCRGKWALALRGILRRRLRKRNRVGGEIDGLDALIDWLDFYRSKLFGRNASSEACFQLV